MSLSNTTTRALEKHRVGNIGSATRSPDSNPQGSLGWTGLNATQTADGLGWENSELYKDWYSSIHQGNPDDFVILITASSKTPVSGTGKTTMLTGFGKRCDIEAGSLDAEWGAEDKATLDAGKLAYDITPDAPPKSALAFDEAQGAPGTKGLDNRRGMQQESIDALNGILANRDDQYTILISAQHTNMLDSRLFTMVDAWVMIKRSPNHPKGPLATYHRIYTEDYEFGGGTIKTPAIEDFTWPAIPDDDPDYRALEEMKQEAKKRRSDDDEEGSGSLPNEQQAAVAQEYRNMGKSLRWISENVDAVEYSRNWISEHTVDPDDNE